MKTKEEVRDVFYYKDGKLYRKYTANNRALKDTMAGTLGGNGYLKVFVNYKQFLIHRLIWTYHYGEIPKQFMIDHIDMNQLNNRIENLRLVTNQENQYNRISKGYSYSSKRKKWRVCFAINGKTKHIGYYNTEEEANIVAIEQRKIHQMIQEREPLDG